jgi:hypothetical protein
MPTLVRKVLSAEASDAADGDDEQSSSRPGGGAAVVAARLLVVGSGGGGEAAVRPRTPAATTPASEMGDGAMLAMNGCFFVRRTCAGAASGQSHFASAQI